MEDLKSFMVGVKMTYDEMDLCILKCLAKKAKIERYYWMSKKELIAAIEAVRLGQTPQKPKKQPVKSTSMCEHKRQKYICKECGVKGICQHGKSKFYCKECGGSQICEHKKSKYFCKECGGKGICEHGNNKFVCKECHKSIKDCIEKIDYV